MTINFRHFALLTSMAYAALLCEPARAQVATPITLTGSYLQVGISSYGTFGSNGSTEPGILHDPTGKGNFYPDGIANDYLTPGTPHDGYSIHATETGLIGNDNDGSPGTIGTASPTLLTGAAAKGYSNAATWSSSYSSYLTIQNSYFFNKTDESIRVVTIITALANLSNVAFSRSEDPDPDVNRFGSYDTVNTRGDSVTSPQDLVSGAGQKTGLTIGIFNQSGSTYKHNTEISSDCCSTDDPYTILANTDTLAYPAVNNGDYGLQMAWLIGNLAAGQSAEIDYAYVFGTNQGSVSSSVVINTTDGDLAPNTFSLNSNAAQVSPLMFDGGVLQLSGGSFAGNIITAPVLISANNGTVDTSTGSGGFSGVVSGPGSLTIEGGNTFSLTNANSYAGGTVINASTVAIGNGAALGTGAVTFNAGTLQAAADNLVVANAAVLGGNGTVDTQAFTLDLTGAITGPGGLTKIGSGTLGLSGASTYTGQTTVSAGTLQLAVGGSLTSDLVNSATVGNSGTWTGNVLSNSATVGNAGTWAGNVVSNSGTIGNIGAWTGNVLANTGTIGNGAVWAGTVNNTAGGTFLNGGLLVGALTNAGTFNALGSVVGAGTPPEAVNGPITNTGLFNVTGPTSVSSSSFYPIAGFAAVTFTTDGLTTSSGSFDNFGTLHVAAGGTYKIAGSLFNEVGGTVAVDAGGTLTDDLVNAGGVTNNGLYVANVNPNTGTITNNGTWTGNLLNNAGGLVSNTGTWNGDTVNQAGAVVADSGMFNGNFTNNGALVVTGSTGRVVSPTLTNGGTIDLSQSTNANPIAATSYVGGAGSKIVIGVDLRSQAISATGGQATQLTFGSATGATTLAFANQGTASQISYYPLISVVKTADGNTSAFTADPASLAALQNGVVTYAYSGGNLVGSMNAAAAAVAGAQGAAVLTTLNTNFFQDWQPFERQAFITAPQDVAANTLAGGPWIRGKYGNGSDEAISTGAGISTPSRVDTEFSGFQVGGDIGVFNANGTGWNYIAGLTAGEFFATSVEKRGSSTKGSFEIPYVGGYVAATRGPFFVDVLYHHDFYGLKLNDAPSGLANQALHGDGDNVMIESAYNIALGDFGTFGHLFISPTGSLVVSKVSLDPLPFTALGLGKVKFNDIDSVLGRGGFRFGSNFTTDTLALQPFFQASVWHEFEGNTQSEFDATSGAIVPMSTSRVGTFGQFTLGLNGELLGKNILGSIKGDFRYGDNTQGESVTAQLRYQF